MEVCLLLGFYLTGVNFEARFHRAMTRPFFSKDRISHFDIFERHADDALSQLKTRLKEGYAVDVQATYHQLTII